MKSAQGVFEGVLRVALAGLVTVAVAAPALAADDSKVRGATQQVEDGARKIGNGQVGDGVSQTAKGIGGTVSEGAKYTGEKLKESGRAAEPQARSAWDNTRDGAVAFGRSVRDFFSSLFAK